MGHIARPIASTKAFRLRDSLGQEPLWRQVEKLATLLSDRIWNR